MVVEAQKLDSVTGELRALLGERLSTAAAEMAANTPFFMLLSFG